MKEDIRNIIIYTSIGIGVSLFFIRTANIDYDPMFQNRIDITYYFGVYMYTQDFDTLLVYFMSMILIIIPPVYYLLSTRKKKINSS